MNNNLTLKKLKGFSNSLKYQGYSSLNIKYFKKLKKRCFTKRNINDPYEEQKNNVSVVYPCIHLDLESSEYEISWSDDNTYDNKEEIYMKRWMDKRRNITKLNDLIKSIENRNKKYLENRRTAAINRAREKTPVRKEKRKQKEKIKY